MINIRFRDGSNELFVSMPKTQITSPKKAKQIKTQNIKTFYILCLGILLGLFLITLRGTSEISLICAIALNFLTPLAYWAYRCHQIRWNHSVRMPRFAPGERARITPMTQEAILVMVVMAFMVAINRPFLF